jgi:hypothetical protein
MSKLHSSSNQPNRNVHIDYERVCYRLNVVGKVGKVIIFNMWLAVMFTPIDDCQPFEYR